MSDVEETVIPFETVRVPNGDKPKGFEEVVSDGVNGKRTVTKNEDGQVVSDKTTPARNEVIYFGTKEDGEQTDSLSSGKADDAVVNNSKETVSTPEPPQEETPKQPSENPEVGSDALAPPTDGYSIQPQGSFSTKQEISNVNTSTLKKAALEAARLLVFAIPGILITVFSDNPSLGGSLGGTILLILKSLDRGIHENKETAVKGLLPF